jgi:hypothetical protein
MVVAVSSCSVSPDIVNREMRSMASEPVGE